MSSIRLRSSERRLSRAVRIAMLGMTLAGAAGTSQLVHAAGISLDAAASQTYNIPAGPLGRNLSTFAAQSGVALSFEPAVTAGLNSPALNGNFSPRAAMTQLLAGSGLDVTARADGSYAVTKNASGDVPRESSVLPVVQVTSGLGSTTENTGSYTTGAASTATRLNMSLRETPQSVSVITRQRMEDQGLTQLQDVIAQTPGLSIAQSGNAGSDSSPIYSRGFAVENYQIDGVGQVYSGYSSIFQTNDMAIYDRAEIVRGATGLMNGVGTPSATVNLVRKRPTPYFQASARVEAGSWNYYRAEADISAPLNEAGNVRGRIVAAWQDNDSYIDRLNEKKKILYGIVDADISAATKASVGFTIQHHDATGHARGGLPAYNSNGTPTNWSRSASAAAEWAYSERHTESIFASLEHQFANDWMVKGVLSHAKSHYDEVLGYASGGAPNPSTGAGVSLWAGRWRGDPIQTTLDVYATGPFSLFGRQHELVVGATSSRVRDDTEGYSLWTIPGYSSAIPNIYTWDGRTPGAPNNPAVSDITTREGMDSLYATARFKPTDALSIILGMRTTDWYRDNTSVRYSTGVVTRTPRSESGQVTPYAGLVYDINDNWSAFVSYTDIFKPQSNRDINGQFIDPLLGNAYELGLKGEFFNKKLNVSGSVYQVKQDNFAVLIVPNIPVEGGFAYQAVSGTKTHGFEVDVSGQVARNWQASVGFSRNLSEDRFGGRLNSNIPQNTFKVFSTYKVPAVEGLTVGGGLRWQGEIYTNSTTTGRFTQKAYSLVDLMARYAITKQMGVTVNLYNAFDKYYFTNTGSSYYGAPRNIRVALDMRF